MGAPIDISTYGKLSIATDASARLLVVFGGIDVDGVSSGVYMWNYMDKVKDRFHVFVASSHKVNGLHAYRELISTLEKKELTPSEQILYLFSGGYRPGMDLLPAVGAMAFSSIWLVDIWMGVPKKNGKLITVVPDFYKKLVDANASKIKYIYTEKGAVNGEARDYIARKVGGIKVEGSHMSTNTVALNNLR